MVGWRKRLDGGPPLVIGHRGYPARCPENTMASFEAAIDAGADAVELDVRLSRDGALVVLHDDTVDRTTDGTGRVDQLDLAALEDLDAGSRFGSAFAAERIPTLDAVLDAFGDRVLLNLELKPGDVPGGRDLADRVARAIGARGLEAGVVVSCFDHAPLRRLAEASPDIPRSLLLDGRPSADLVRAQASALDALFVSPGLADVPRAELERLAEGLDVIPFTANDPATVRWCRRAGMRGVFTDEVTMARRTLEES